MSVLLLFGSLTQLAFAQSNLNPSLVQSLQGLTGILPRAISTFHYAPKADVGLPAGPVDSAQPDIQRTALAYRLKVMAEYQALNFPNANFGFNGVLMGPNGFYVAIDPVISRRFGGANWSLQEVRIPAQARYFDGRSAQPFAPDVQNFVHSFGCPMTTSRELLTSNTSNLGCMQALRAITHATGATSIAYWYMRNSLPLCIRAGGQYGTAFVIVDPSGIEPHVNIFTREAPSPRDSLAQERQNIVDFFAGSGQGSADFLGISPSVSQDMVNSWAGQNLYRCDSQVKE